jgi:hypothetical protein
VHELASLKIEPEHQEKSGEKDSTTFIKIVTIGLLVVYLVLFSNISSCEDVSYLLFV